MRIGVFCTYENHERDFARCFDMQTRYVQHAEALGIDEAWVAEHHFDPDAVSPSILMLLAYLAGVTSRIRLGSAAVLIAFRNPIQVAEDVATIDILSNGRFDFGVAKGGPFALQNKHFHAGADHSRDMTLEALGLVNRLLYQDHVSFTGEYYQASDVTITPKPLQRPIPTYLATTTPGAIRYAARNDLGVMAAPPYPLSRVLDIIETYREASGSGADPRLTLARFFYAAPTREEALAEAVPFIRRFSERIGGIFRAQAGVAERSLRRGRDHRAFADRKFRRNRRENRRAASAHGIALLAVEAGVAGHGEKLSRARRFRAAGPPAPAGRRSRAEGIVGGAMTGAAA